MGRRTRSAAWVQHGSVKPVRSSGVLVRGRHKRSDVWVQSGGHAVEQGCLSLAGACGAVWVQSNGPQSKASSPSSAVFGP